MPWIFIKYFIGVVHFVCLYAHLCTSCEHLSRSLNFYLSGVCQDLTRMIQNPQIPTQTHFREDPTKIYSSQINIPLDNPFPQLQSHLQLLPPPPPSPGRTFNPSQSRNIIKDLPAFVDSASHTRQPEFRDSYRRPKLRDFVMFIMHRDTRANFANCIALRGNKIPARGCLFSWSRD